jgi:hypothetical protein
MRKQKKSMSRRYKKGSICPGTASLEEFIERRKSKSRR